MPGMDLSNDAILQGAIKTHKADPNATDEVPKDLDTEIAVDPKDVAKGEEGDINDKPKLDKDGKPIPAEDDFEPYIPEDPKKPEAKPEPPKEVKKEETPAPAKDEDIAAFEAKLKADGYEDDAIRDFVQAVELGGKMALKRLEAARKEEVEANESAKRQQDENMTALRTQEYQSIGHLQKDGRIPKVPVEVQKKLASGVAPTEEEAKLPGVVRQTDVWNYMTNENKKVAQSGQGYYITTFAQALDLLEAKEIREGKVKETEREAEVRKQKARQVAGGGNNGSGGDTKKPGYIRGQSLDQVAMEIQREYRSS